MSLTAVWLVYLIQPVSGLFGHHHSPLYIGGGMAIIAAFCVVFVHHDRRLEPDQPALG